MQTRGQLTLAGRLMGKEAPFTIKNPETGHALVVHEIRGHQKGVRVRLYRKDGSYILVRKDEPVRIIGRPA